jgi:hypothetical protein
VYANGEWFSPKQVFLGPAIFGRRRPFVAKQPAGRLWATLNIKPPNLRDCIQVLEEIAYDASEEPDAEVLARTYLHMADILISRKI